MQLTHGGMPYGAGKFAAEKFGAAEVVDPRPWLKVGEGMAGSMLATCMEPRLLPCPLHLRVLRSESNLD